MQNLIIRVSFALVTFITGLTIPPATQGPKPGESALRMDQMLAAARPKQLSFLGQDPKATRRGDLSIVVAVAQPNPNPPSLEARTINLDENQLTVADLGLGEDLDDQEVTLNLADHSVDYRMFQRYRTSMSISNEGPHLDLVDWRHFDSPWSQLPSLSPRRFRTLRSDQMDSGKFPPTTQSEILDEVRRHVGTDSPFLDLVKTCHGPNDAPCWVGISSIYFLIQKQVGGRWIHIGLVEFRLPMGC